MENTQMPAPQAVSMPSSVPIQKPKSLLPFVFLSIFASLATGILGYYLGRAGLSNTSSSTQIACTLEAKICPDGSSVGRVGPNCEFAPCPTPETQQSLQTVTSEKGGYSLKIPSDWRITTRNEDDSLLAKQDYSVNLVLSSPKGESEGQGQFLNAITIPFPFSISGPHYDLGVKFEKGLSGLFVNNPNPVNAKSIVSEYIQVNILSGLSVKTVMVDTEAELSEGFAGEYCLGCTFKTIYVDLGNGKILEMDGAWEKGYSEFETAFDQIVQTLTLK